MQAPQNIELIWAKSSPRQMKAVSLRDEGLSYRKIGIEMGITRQRAMELEQKGRDFLKEQIARSAR